LEGLRARLAKLRLLDADSLDEVATALADAELELVYFYCHGVRRDQGGTVKPALAVGRDELIVPADLLAWGLARWAPEHWQRTAPLVLINGCHTAELSPESLVNFVDAFAGVGASGVIGTEIALHQQVAGEAALELLEGIQDNRSVGDAMQRMRRHLLGKGNLLGLAYTAYCSAELRLTA